MKRNLIFVIIILLFFIEFAQDQLPPSSNRSAGVQSTPSVRRYLSPVRVLWKTVNADRNIINEQRLLLPGNGHADLGNKNMCIVKSDRKFILLLDFGKELHQDNTG
jgi:hypothetical protein